MEISREEVRKQAVDRMIMAERRRSAVVELADRLRPLGGRAIVIKGLHIAYEVANDPTYRNMADADVVLMGMDFDAAMDRLTKDGSWRMTSREDTNVGLLCAPGLMIDIHGQPLPRAFGRWQRNAFFARTRPAPQIGDALWVPDEQDAAIIALGNFVRDRLNPRKEPRLALDIDILSQRGEFGPDALNQRLHSHALCNVGLLSFSALALRDRRWEAWCAAIEPRSRRREWMKRSVAILRSIQGAHPALGGIASVAVMDSVSDSLRSLFSHVAHKGAAVLDRSRR